MVRYERMKKAHKSNFNFRHFVFTLLALTVIVMAIIPLYHTQLEAKKIALEYREAQTENERAISEQRQAFQMAKQLENPTFLADVARRDYYYSLPGEIIFELGDDVSRDGLSH